MVRHSLSLLVAVSIVAGCGGPSPVDIPRPITDREYLNRRELMVPVHGIHPRDLRDTYNAPRSGARAHLAMDVMARRGTRVLSADNGTVRRIGTNALGGKTVYVVDDEQRFVHYYAHLDAWASGLKVGRRVRRGDVLGTVGTTGNSPSNAPHLHYQLLRYRKSRMWWTGDPVNPIPYMQHRGNAR